MFLSDAVSLLGSIRTDRGSSYSQGYWQEVESVIHALSALAGRLPSLLAAESVCAALLGAISVHSSSRPVVTTTVHAFMAFSPSLIGWSATAIDTIFYVSLNSVLLMYVGQGRAQGLNFSITE